MWISTQLLLCKSGKFAKSVFFPRADTANSKKKTKKKNSEISGKPINNGKAMGRM